MLPAILGGGALLGKALTAAGILGTAATVAPPVIDSVTGNTGRDMRKQILSDGPDRSEGKPVFRTNFLQNQFIDEQSLLPQYYKEKRAEVKKDPEVAALMRQLGPGAVTINDDEEASSVAARYAQDFKDSKLAEALDLDKKKRDAAFNDPTSKNQRDIAAADRIENNKRFDLAEAKSARLEREGRLDRIDQRTSDRELRMLELGMQERMFDKRLASEARASKKERMAAIIAGLTNLGGAFAL